MIIAIYGVSRSGKNYLIEQVTNTINKKCPNALFHVNGSETLNSISLDKFGITLKQTSESQKQELRLLFFLELAKLKDNYQNLIIDAHYSFYINDELVTAFNKKDRETYDYYCYIDTPASKIIEQANLDLDENKKDVAFMNEEQINKWKNHEIQSLKEICRQDNKEFIVLDNNITDCIDFFETLILSTRNVLLDSNTIAQQIILANQQQIENYDKIIVIDCDRTISNNDTTYDYCKYASIEKQTLKEIFYGEHYSLYQFFRIAKLYAINDNEMTEKASDYAANKAVLNTSLLNDIADNGKDYLTFGITSGILNIWKKIQNIYKFPAILAGSSNINTDNFIVSRTVKYYLVKYLQEQKKEIIVIGDSIIDIDMLNAVNKSFIIAQDKLNSSLVNYFKTNKTKIMQLEYSFKKYDELPIKRSIFDEYSIPN
jgi:phosphoserine phosphatase